MGFFSAIGRAFSGAISSLGRIATGVVKAAAGAIGGVMRSAVGALASLGAKVGGVLGGVLTKGAGVLGTFGTILSGPLGTFLAPILVQVLIHFAGKLIESIAKKDGTLDPEDNIEDVGYRMEEAAEHPEWKKMEEFENLHDYHAYLKEQIPAADIDQQKMRQNRFRYTCTGIAAVRDEWAKRLGIGIPDSFIFDFSRAKLTEVEISLIIDVFKSLGASSVQFHDFLTGKMTQEELKTIQDGILQAYLKAYPDKSAVDAVARINEWKQAATDDGAAVQNHYEAMEAVAQDMRRQEESGVPEKDIVIDVQAIETAGR